MTSWNGKHGPLIIAEIGGNHEGSFEYAQELTQLACESGVDAVKFQIYTGDSLVNKIEDPDRNRHFNNFVLEQRQYIKLAEQCHENGVIFTASVWDPSAFDWIDPFIPFYKIGSGDLTALSLIDKIISKRKPILLSTGLSTMGEVEEAVRYIRSKDDFYIQKNNLALLQCTSMYPIPIEEANLNVMQRYREKFNIRVGYSDHTEGTLAVETAISMGAEIIEFHFTNTRDGKAFRDHKVSLTKAEVIKLIDKVKLIKKLMGNGIKRPLKSEEDSGHISSFRRGLYFARDIKKGAIIEKADIVELRPNYGIDGKLYGSIIGLKLNVDVAKHCRISFELFD